MSRYLFTSESVSEGHPDKICDQISDAVLDAALAQDAKSRVACETLCKTGFVVIAGEITTQAQLNFGQIARRVVKDIGYTDSQMGFDGETCGVLIAVEPQSPDISQGVTEGQGLFAEQGAGDQGLMFGYACDETPELMPAPIMYAHALLKKLSDVRRSGAVDFLRPDSKSQVTLEYEDGKPTRIDAVVVSTQHSADVSYEDLSEAVMELCVKKTLDKRLLDKKTKYFINPTGRFVIGGPFGDAGLTGRKIIVDTYGGMGRHGGGAFSGKDPSKVDRSAAYYARYVAKNIVAAKLATRCEVQLAYAIGVAKPVGVFIDTFGTGVIDKERLENYVLESFDMRPKAIIEQLDLTTPRYQSTASYGHFGRSEFPWERTDRAKELADALIRGKTKGKKVEVAEATPRRAAASKGRAVVEKRTTNGVGARSAETRKAAPAAAPRASKARGLAGTVDVGFASGAGSSRVRRPAKSAAAATPLASAKRPSSNGEGQSAAGKRKAKSVVKPRRSSSALA